MRTIRATAAALWTLLTLFALRVVGQLLVALCVAPFLPPMDDWQSGLLPYPLLLASQVLILALFGTICVQFSRGRGYFVQPQRWFATPLWIFGWVYASAMGVRYALLRTDIIPVAFHLVLGGFLLVLARYQKRGLGIGG